MPTSPSSIFSSKTLDWRGFRLPKAALLTVAILAAFEGSLHLGRGYLPDPVVWGSGQAPAKIAQVQRLAGSGKRVDVLVLGPSHASVGIAPRVMAESAPSPLRVYNGAINGRDYVVLKFVLEHVYLDALRPRVLVISTNPINFNRHHPLLADNTLEFFDAPMPRALCAAGIEGWWRRFLVEHVYLYRYRRREWRLADGFVAGKRSLDDDGFAGLEGTFDNDERRRLFSPQHGYRGVWQAYEFGGPSLDGLIGMLELAKARGIAVAIVNMPFRPELLQLSTEGSSAYAAYLRGMAELRSRYGFAWLDYQARLELGDADFRDVDHLNTAGTAKVSTALAHDVRPFLQSRGDPPADSGISPDSRPGE